MYDISRAQTFEGLEAWIREVHKYGGENLPVFVVGSKSDLNDRRAVPRPDAEKWVK